MSPLIPMGLAIALNATMLGAGTIWLRRQAKRVSDERVVEYRGLFQLEPLPKAGNAVQILVEDDDSRTSEITAVHWPGLGWTDAVTLLKVEEDVLGWRLPPFRAPPAVDYVSWPREKLAAETGRRFGPDKCG